VLFLHVVSALGIVSALSLEVLMLYHLRRAVVPREARASLDLVPRVALVFVSSAVLMLLTGAYLAVQTLAWPQPWLRITFASLILMVPFGAVAGRRLRVLRRLSDSEHAGDAELARRLQDPVLTFSVNCRMALVLGIVLLMTAKPDLRESVGVCLMSLVAGFASAALFWRGSPAPVARASSGNNR
jgi:predicted integral membrane protein DUF2269